MTEQTIGIEGMHCKSCETLIEGELKNIKGIDKVKADFRRSSAKIFYEEEMEPDRDKIKSTIEKAGYRLKTGDPKSKSSTLLAVLFLGLLGLAFLLVQNLNLNFLQQKNYSSLWVVLLVGVAAGFSTCMALLGSLILSWSTQNSIKPALKFNIFRIVSFLFFGGILGSFGKIISFDPRIFSLLIILISLYILFLGVKMLNLFPSLNKITIVMPSFLRELSQIKKPAVLGVLSFFFPCAFTQAMQIYTISTASFVKGALTMGVFALGTSLGLMGIGSVGTLAKGRLGKNFYTAVGVILIVASLVNIKNGLALSGLAIPRSNNPAPQQSEKPQTNGDTIQVINMEQGVRGYVPNYFEIRKGIPVKWIIKSTRTTCASFLVIPELKISKFLELGENVLEFTPQKAGNVNFSCSMGMYYGSFRVVEK